MIEIKTLLFMTVLNVASLAATLSDVHVTTQPVYANSTVTADVDTVSLSLQYGEAWSASGSVYYMVLPVGAPPPNAQQIRVGLDGSEASSLCNGYQTTSSTRANSISFKCNASMLVTGSLYNVRLLRRFCGERGGRRSGHSDERVSRGSLSIAFCY
jgi:hypothetical protein